MRVGTIPADCKDAQLCPARIADIKERYGRAPQWITSFHWVERLLIEALKGAS